jgi:hypothetical protein
MSVDIDPPMMMKSEDIRDPAIAFTATNNQMAST